ncbi:LOW QUALITY PROTEIN: hypothetical protein V1477_015028 [Vespula maculifrons]|uniref:Uncharacterized protein n=1 Tax=Vespula maculifrons TaxID=7453 RepID=A0ABD2BJ43_VESMC
MGWLRRGGTGPQDQRVLWNLPPPLPPPVSFGSPRLTRRQGCGWSATTDGGGSTSTPPCLQESSTVLISCSVTALIRQKECKGRKGKEETSCLLGAKRQADSSKLVLHESLACKINSWESLPVSNPIPKIKVNRYKYITPTTILTLFRVSEQERNGCRNISFSPGIVHRMASASLGFDLMSSMEQRLRGSNLNEANERCRMLKREVCH